jgi:predicted transcriptional regulator
MAKQNKQLELFKELVAEGKTRTELQEILGMKRSAVQQYASRHKISLRKVAENCFFLIT